MQTAMQTIKPIRVFLSVVEQGSFAGVFNESVSNGSLYLTKTSAGTLTLTGARVALHLNALSEYDAFDLDRPPKP